MKLRTKSPATLSDWEALPEHVKGELIDDELVVAPGPGGPHQFVASTLGNVLGPSFQWGRGGPGGWWILYEPVLELGRNVLIPDLAGWRKERLGPAELSQPRFTIAPDWVCEILSASTGGHDRVRKAHLYAASKVRHLWLIDPAFHTLEVYRLEAGGWLQVASHMKAERVRAEPFEAVELDLSLLWVPGVADPELEPYEPELSP